MTPKQMIMVAAIAAVTIAVVFRVPALRSAVLGQ